MTSYVIDLTRLEEFDIIIYLKIDISLIIYYLTYLTFLYIIYTYNLLTYFLSLK